MFDVRLVLGTCSVFVLVYCGLSLAVGCGWRWFCFSDDRYSARGLADYLFVLRLFPVIAATGVTLIFTIPSFVFFEPRTVEEELGIAPLRLTLCGLMLAGIGTWNAGWALKSALRAIAVWMAESQLVESRGAVPIVRISRVVPALTTAGIFRPRILISEMAESLLTEKELQTALRHELAHVQRRDNLRKLLVRLFAFPGMASLEAAWLEASELAADDAAVFSAGEALDLAAALIKLSRLAPAVRQADSSATLAHSPMAALFARLQRLMAWTGESPFPKTRRYSSWSAAAALLAVAGTFAVTYRPLLARVHTATEWLLR